MMYRYTIFCPKSGSSLGTVLAHNPALACAVYDRGIGEHNRQYEDIGSALFKGRYGYSVFSNGLFVARIAIFDKGE
jgi:hypothetical protein